MVQVGPGCPDLTLRAAVRLLLTYTQASFSRNLLARRYARYLSTARVPGSEAEPLAAAAAALSVQVVVLPDPGVRDLQVHLDGDREALMAQPPLLLATDGALRQQAGGGGIVFYAPGAGVVLRAWFRCLVWASPSSREWLACLVALALLDGWKGTLLSALDATSALFRSYTRQPPKFTLLDALWCHLIPTLLHLEAHHELWLRAQHDTTDRDLLASLKSMAHSLATRGARGATPWTIPLLPRLHERLVLFHCGALLLDPELGLDAAYHAAASAAYFTARRETCLRADGAHFLALLEGDKLPTVAVKRAFAYRILEWQPPPALYIPMECHFCALTNRQPARHVRSRCMPEYQRLLWAQAIVLQSVPAAQGGYVCPDGTLY